MTLKHSQLLQNSSQALKTFFQLLQIKRLQLKLTNTHKTPTKYSHNIKFLGHGSTTSNNTTNHKNKRKSISKLFHAQTGSIWFQIGSYLVPIGSYGFSSSQIGSYNVKWFPNCSPAHTLFQDRFKDVQVGPRWFSTLYILSPNFHFLESKANVLQLRK